MGVRYKERNNKKILVRKVVLCLLLVFGFTDHETKHSRAVLETILHDSFALEYVFCSGDF